MADLIFNPQTRQYGDLQPDGSVKVLDPAQVSPDTLARYTPDLALSVRQTLSQAIQTGDIMLQRARTGTAEAMATPFGNVPGSELLNPVPGSVAEAAAMAATLPIRGGAVSGLLKRSAASGLAGGTVEALKGQEPFGTAAKFAGTQAAMETPFAALSLALNARALGQAKTKAAQTNAFNDAMAETLTAADKKQYLLDKQAIDRTYALGRLKHRRAGQQAQADYLAKGASDLAMYERRAAAHAEAGAALVAADFKKSVPAWDSFPSTTRGLDDMVYGRGQEVVSAKYEAGMKSAIATARGKTLILPERDATALNLPTSGPFGTPTQGQPAQVLVDAAEAIRGIAGKSREHAGAYRRVAWALDSLGIGDPALRAEYKASQALIQFADKSQMLAKGVYHPDKALAGLTRLKVLTELRGRGHGDLLRGSIAESVRDIPVPPTAGPPPTRYPYGIPRPQMPPPTMPRTATPVQPEGFTSVTFPKAEHPFVAGAATQTAASLGGLDVPFGTPFATGAMLNLALGGRTMTTGAPRGAIAELLLQTPPSILREMFFAERP